MKDPSLFPSGKISDQPGWWVSRRGNRLEISWQRSESTLGWKMNWLVQWFQSGRMWYGKDWLMRLLSISNPSSLLWLIILCVKWNSPSSKIHLSHCSDIFCCRRRGSAVHFVHMQIFMWTDELSCFCFVFLYPGNYKQVFLFNVVKSSIKRGFCSNGELGEPSSGQAKEISIATAASQTRLGARERNMCYIFKR